MRNNWIFIILFISIIIFISCNKSTANKRERIYNGVDSKILNIVDSICPVYEELPFISIDFFLCPDSSNVIRFFNSMSLPPPPLPSAPWKEMLISESESFVGYKKYNEVYLVFSNHDLNNELLNKFVEIDSLSFDEELFTLFDVYKLFDERRKRKKCKPIEKKYLIDKNDSLILYNGACLLDTEFE